MKLIQSIQAHGVPNGAVTLWWLGQASFILKSPKGRVLAIDPYLTNSCKDAAAKAGFNADRLFPTLIEPGDLTVDVIALTHSHQDHCDPETIAGYRSAGALGPARHVTRGPVETTLSRCVSFPGETARL